MNKRVPRKPDEMTPAGFCRLAVLVAEEKLIGNVQQCAKKFHISTSRWLEIKKNKMPDFTHHTERALNGYVESITRICEVLELDIISCLEACDLPYRQRSVNTARGLLTPEIILDEESVQSLLELIKLTGKPISLSFGLEFLAYRQKPASTGTT